MLLSGFSRSALDVTLDDRIILVVKQWSLNGKFSLSHLKEAGASTEKSNETSGLEVSVSECVSLGILDQPQMQIYLVSFGLKWPKTLVLCCLFSHFSFRFYEYCLCIENVCFYISWRTASLPLYWSSAFTPDRWSWGRNALKKDKRLGSNTPFEKQCPCNSWYSSQPTGDKGIVSSKENIWITLTFPLYYGGYFS